MSDKVLAVAAGHEITEDELIGLIRNYPDQQQLSLMSPEGRAQVLEQLIAFHLFAQMAEEEKIMESEEYKTMIEKMKKELASHMAATSSIVGVTVDSAAEKAFYEQNKEKYLSKAQVRASHILVDSKEKAIQVCGEIADGKSFEQAAKEHSTCPSSEQGGDLGYFSKGQMVPEFEKAAFDGEVGRVLGPIATQFGFHLIEVKDKKIGAEIPFEQAQESIHEHLIQEKERMAYDEKVAELEQKYGVERK
jgi:peptidyl-prolyl cis-trans isomerase C